MQQSTQDQHGEPTPPQASPAAGIRLVLGLVLLGVALASFAIWFQWHQTRRCLELYGSRVARLIQAAPRVELWEPQTVPERNEEVDGRRGVPMESAVRIDLSGVRGLVHLRRGLVEDANFDWGTREGDGERGEDDHAWDAALAFYDRPGDAEPAALLVFDFSPSGGMLTVAGNGASVGLGRLEKGLRLWLSAARAESGPNTAANRAF
jgi:hypothetical protein